MEGLVRKGIALKRCVPVQRMVLELVIKLKRRVSLLIFGVNSFFRSSACHKERLILRDLSLGLSQFAIRKACRIEVDTSLAPYF